MAHAAGAALAADHLVGIGRTRVVTICGPLDVPAAQDNSGPALASRPRLTTVVQPIEEMARILLEQIESPQQPPRSVIFDPALVIREST